MQTRRKVALKVIALLFVTFLATGCSEYRKYRSSRIAERADRYFKASEYEKAKIEYLNLLRLDHQSVTAFQQLGLIWFEQGVPLRAIPFLLRVRELAPQNNAARSKLALAFMAIGDSGDAWKEAVAVLQNDPGNADAMLVLVDSSQSHEEMTATEQQLQKFPDQSSAVLHLARASLGMKKGDIGSASDEVQQALAADP